jgi:hypothetical protein
VCVLRGDILVTVPAPIEVPTQAGSLHRESPLEVGCRPADYRRLCKHPSTNLARDPVETDSREGADVFEDVPRPGVGTHLLDHILTEILPAVIALVMVAVGELAA